MRGASMRRRLFPVLVTLLALGGCAGMMRTMTNEYPQTVSTARGILQEAAAAGPVLLEVRDTLFYADVPQVLAEAASATSIGFMVKFTPHRTEAAKPDIRVVFQFSPVAGSDAASVCDPLLRVARVDEIGRLNALVA